MIKVIPVCLFIISIIGSHASKISSDPQASSTIADSNGNSEYSSMSDLDFPELDHQQSTQSSLAEQDEIQLHLSSLQQRRPNFATRLPDKDYLSHELAEKACRLDRGCQRKDKLNNTYLSYCSRHKLENLLSNEILMSMMHDSSDQCEKILDEFIQLDEQINHFDQLFKTLLQRYNCHNGYSVKWNCDDCKVSEFSKMTHFSSTTIKTYSSSLT